MITEVMRLPYGRRLSATGEQRAHLLQRRGVFRLDGDLWSELAGGRFWDESGQRRSHALAFLLFMAALSLVRGVGEGLIGKALLGWGGIVLDPFTLCAALHVGATLVGIGVAVFFAKAALDSTAGKHMLLTLVAAMSIGLILAWLSQIVGCANACHWPLVIVYLLWAWVEAVSNAQSR